MAEEQASVKEKEPRGDRDGAKESHKRRSPDRDDAGDGDRKRQRFGGQRGGRGRGGKRQRDMGRNEWNRHKLDRRSRTDSDRPKKPSDKPSVLPAAFDQDEIDAEGKRPKRKVAVLVGYSGTGYRGMQITPTERTIEGDLFTAFVKAGAISKANADDPKKSSLVRCARTDKGVHAAGNMISLKLIIEDDDVVEKINSHLSPQIRVWGIERTTGSFSCYKACDSRWYEYLIPTHALLPPHHHSFLHKRIREIADEKGDWAAVVDRQKDVEGFWEKVEEEDIKPLLASFDEDIREILDRNLYPDWDERLRNRETQDDTWLRGIADMDKVGGAKIAKSSGKKHRPRDEDSEDEDETEDPEPADPAPDAVKDDQAAGKLDPQRKEALIAAGKRVRQAYDQARRRYRIDAARITRLQETLSAYVGTRNFHNYTVQKPFDDPSAKRTIMSFDANREPILINGTEWLSLKVHGQSFMMHQIRKMVGMAALLVRAGADGPTRIRESYGRERWPVPKVPGLGLLLERPVFDSYNTHQAAKFGREGLDFAKHDAAIREFKGREIYERIWRQEADENTFHQFFHHIDNYTQPHFLYLTSGGWEMTQRPLDWKPTAKLEGEPAGEVNGAARSGVEGQMADGIASHD